MTHINNSRNSPTPEQLTQAVLMLLRKLEELKKPGDCIDACDVAETVNNDPLAVMAALSTIGFAKHVTVRRRSGVRIYAYAGKYTVRFSLDIAAGGGLACSDAKVCLREED